jgi:hypothetical protein
MLLADEAAGRCVAADTLPESFDRRRLKPMDGDVEAKMMARTDVVVVMGRAREATIRNVVETGGPGRMAGTGEREHDSGDRCWPWPAGDPRATERSQQAHACARSAAPTLSR